jgi:hypothetical protein
MTVRKQAYESSFVSQYWDHRTGDKGISRTKVTKAWTDSFAGVENPNFIGQIRTHTDATTNASWNREDYRSFGTATYKLWNVPSNHAFSFTEYSNSGVIIPLAGLDSELAVSTADANARIAFRNKVRSVQTAFQGGTFLGELREAVHGIKHPVQALRKGVDDLITASRRNAKQALRGLTSKKVSRVAVVNRAARDTWLEWAFDKRPLISDIASFADAIIQAPNDDIQGVVGRSDDTTRRSIKAQTGAGYVPTNVEYQLMLSRRTSVRYLGAVRMSAVSPTVNTLRKFGLDWSNVAPALWELCPNSFLVDYFSNVGNLIDAATTTNFEVIWGCKTQIQETSAHFLSAKWVDAPTISGTVDVGSYVNYRRSGTRSKFNSADIGVSILDVRTKMPGFGSLKWLNIAGLVNGAFFR